MRRALDVEVELVKGSGGIFVVEVGGAVVALKTPERGFPEEDEIVRAVRAAVG